MKLIKMTRIHIPKLSVSQLKKILQIKTNIELLKLFIAKYKILNYKSSPDRQKNGLYILFKNFCNFWNIEVKFAPNIILVSGT